MDAKISTFKDRKGDIYICWWLSVPEEGLEDDGEVVLVVDARVDQTLSVGGVFLLDLLDPRPLVRVGTARADHTEIYCSDCAL